jgi:hypothetical protein
MKNRLTMKVPVFWEQTGIQISHRIEITRSQEATRPVVSKHFSVIQFNPHNKDMYQSYENVHVVHLLKNDPASSEFLLSELYKTHLSQLNIPYSHFDFHSQTKDGIEKVEHSSNS